MQIVSAGSLLSSFHWHSLFAMEQYISIDTTPNKRDCMRFWTNSNPQSRWLWCTPLPTWSSSLVRLMWSSSLVRYVRWWGTCAGEVRALVRYVRETCTCAREELLRCEIISKSLKSLIPKAGTKSIPFPALMKISLYLKYDYFQNHLFCEPPVFVTRFLWPCPAWHVSLLL